MSKGPNVRPCGDQTFGPDVGPGLGARIDAAGAPHDVLLQARRGAAFFARLLTRLDAAALTQQARRAVAVHVAYQGRAMAERFAALRLDAQMSSFDPMPDAAQIALGMTLPDHALRHLVRHAQVHLNVEWRDLPGPLWSARIDMQGAATSPAALVQMRARALWQGGLALQAGGRIQDLPRDLRPDT